MNPVECDCFQIYSFMYQSVLCSHFEAKFYFVMKSKIGLKLSDTPYLSNEIIRISMSCKNIKENQRNISNISLKISGEIRQFFPEVVMATLYIWLSHPSSLVTTPI